MVNQDRHRSGAGAVACGGSATSPGGKSPPMPPGGRAGRFFRHGRDKNGTRLRISCKMTREPDPILDVMPALRRYAVALSRDEAEADDLVQDALLRGHEARRSFRPGANLRVWLFAILRNAFLDRRRRRAAESRRDDAAAVLAPLSIDAPQEAAVRLAQVREAFLRLPEDQREALSLVAVEGLTYAAAAAVAGIPIGTLMSRVARARAELRAFEEGRGRGRNLKVVGGRDGTGE